MGVGEYVSLKKENWKLAKYPICVTVFVKDCDINSSNLYEEGVGMCGINWGHNIDNQTIVISATLVINEINNEIISSMNHKEVIEDQFYKDKGTLKTLMTQYAIDNKFQWKAERAREIRYLDLFLSFLIIVTIPPNSML